jgi:ribonuclease HI
VDVCFLLEVMGSHEAFIAEAHGLRALAAKIGYYVRWMVGEGGSQREQLQSSESLTNGIAVLVKRATCTIERHVRIEERVLGVWIRGRNAKEQIRMRIAAIHGLHHDGTSSFSKQLQATYAWAADASQESKGCLVVGDFNYVADVAWRSSGAELDAKDKLFKDFITQPGAEYVLPVEPRPMIVWTRRGGTAGEVSDAEGGGSMLDGAVAIGCECATWRRTIVDFAFDSDGPLVASAKPLSDHAWLTFSREVPETILKGERRPLSALPRGDERIKDGYRDRVRDGDVHEEILRARGTVHAAASAVQALRRAAEQVAAEVRARRQERPLEMAHRWRRWLQEAYAARHRGISPHDVQGGLFNHHSRLWKIRARYESAGDDVCWAKIIRRCRRCWTSANQRLRRKQQCEDARLKELSLGIVEGKGSKDLARLAMLAWKAIRPLRAALAFDRFHPRDDVHEAPTLAATDPDTFLNGLAREGDRLVSGFSSTPPIIEAFKAFCKVFCPAYETLRGRDGGEWELAKELTFPVFLQVLQRVPRGKAVGHGGFSIELLIHAGREVKRAFYDCLMADLLGGEFPPSWRRVIYVLLAKPPPSNQALISERREIALMAQDMKLVMHMVRATAYRLITGRLRSEQCGWLPGYGTVDAGIPLAAVIQQAQRLRQSLWILYVDLATFFPRIDREALTVAEVLIGLPPPVIELVGQIYGAGRAVAAEAVECQFDTSIGLSASFRNHMGALMGEVLSPDRAKIILNSILWAIHLHVHGVQLFGFGEDEEGHIRAIASLAYADDWAGTFTSEADLKRAWAIWSVWVPISGSKLGIKQKLKTVVTGVLRDDQGHESDIVDPRLVTLDGVRVPALTRSEAYKHLGVLRVAMGGDGAAADSLKKQLRAAIGRVARMHKPSRRDMILVTNGLFQGLAGFKCSTVYYTFEWMEDVEKEWRRVFNRKARRDSSTPACLLYEGGGGTVGEGRRHLWAIGCSSFYVAFTRALADREDTSQRAAARSALALGLSRWGVQGDPRTYSWWHLNEALERHLKGRHKYLGESFMFISSLIRDDDAPQENWRWTAEPETWDPLSEARPHFRRLESIALFDTEKMGGLGIEPAAWLLDARIRVAGQMATWGAGEDGPRWLSFEEARRLYPWLHAKAAADWDRTVAALEERLAEVVAPEREAIRAWGQRGLVLDSEGLRLGQRAVKGTSTEEAGEAALHEAIRSTQRAMREGREPERVEWESLLRSTFKGIQEPNKGEWCVGGGDAHADAMGGRIFLDIDCEEEPRGGEASWLRRSDVDEQGFLTGWEERASVMRFHYVFDEMGFLCLRQGGRLEPHQLGLLDPAVQITARARLALGDVEVVAGDGTKRQETHVQLSTQRELWGKLTTWSARICATRIYTLDGGWREVKTENGGKVRIATRAAIDHEGRVLGGRIFEADVKADNYIAELAAQLDALTDAVRRGSEERVILVFDATSPVRAMLRFGRLSARARGDRLAAELLEHFERLRRKVAVLVLLWQTSHVGEPLNEWADVACDTFGLEDDYPIPRGSVKFASMTFPSHRGAAQEYAMQGMRRVVAARLRSRVSGTVLRDNTEHVHLLGVTAETQQLCDEIAARRCQYVDQPYANTMMRRLLQAEWCPFGCRTQRNGWREIHASAGARRRAVIHPRLAAILRTRLEKELGEVCTISDQEESEYDGAEVGSGDAIRDGQRWFARAECAPTWWHFHFECVGDPLLAARKAYALQAVEARRRMVVSQVGKELVPHSQLDDLILLIHQGLQGWVAADGAAGSLAQRQYVQNCIQRGARDAWETEHWRAAAAGMIRISGSRADSNGQWRLALTEMVVRGCRQQQLGKEHCKAGREAFWARVRNLRLLGKIFHAMLRTTRLATVRRRAALRQLRLARDYVANLEGLDGYSRRRLRTAVQEQQAEIQEEQAANGPGEWLMLRVWLAWRLVLARGRGKSGRCVLHGSGRAHLREHLLRAALGDTRELRTTGVRIAELCIAQKHAWRRWLSLGGWWSLHLCNLRLARAKQGRALAAQREGMRRWAKRADGRCWQLLTTQEVEERFELIHEGLRTLLATKQILSACEWRKLGINNLRVGHYVRVGQEPTEVFYGPAEVASQHTLSGRAGEDVGEVMEIEIAPRWDPQRGKRRRQDVLRGRREVRQRIAMGPVRDGTEADDGGRWAVRCIRAVRRHEGRRGRPLDVLVEWEGEDSDGDLWEESWVSVTHLTADLRAEARKLEAELFGPRATQAGHTSRRANHRDEARWRQEREREAQQWRARLRDRAPPPSSA